VQRFAPELEFQSALFAVRRRIQDVGVLDGDPPFHKEGAGRETVKSSPMLGVSMSWNAPDMWVSTSSEVSWRYERCQGKRRRRNRPNRRDGNSGIGVIDSKDRDERNDRTGSRLSGRKRTAFGDVGEVDHLSGTWMGLGMIGGRLMGVGHSGSGRVDKRGVHCPGEGADVEERRWTAKQARMVGIGGGRQRYRSSYKPKIPTLSFSSMKSRLKYIHHSNWPKQL
jgi:hypothetical protein